MSVLKHVIANSSGENLVCVEVLPLEFEKTQRLSYPVAILCHGFAYFKEEDGFFTELAKRLSQSGYAVYYFDFSGCGESEGDYAQTSLTKLCSDLKSVLSFIKMRSYVDLGRLNLIGQSFGTNVLIASQLRSIHKMVLCGSFADPARVLSNLMSDYHPSSLSTKIHSSGRKTTIGPGFWQDLKKYDLVELIKIYDCPVLFLHGEKDDHVPVVNALALYGVIKDRAELNIIEGADHGLLPARDQAIEAIDSFLKPAK